jgi:mannosylglycerate hydrolase
MDGMLALVVSHTHWDRAWYLPFEGYRHALVRTVDEVLDLLEGDPSFAAFALDGQTALLEDYLRVRPAARARIERLARAGRLSFGPCYVLPDEFLVSPEALVRNLRRGMDQSRELGCDPKDGWMPDSFGHVGQMPQILARFGLRSFVFMRGVPKDLWERAGTEFQWESPDGSRVLGVYLRNGYDAICALGHPERFGQFRGRRPDPEAALELARAVLAAQGDKARGALLLPNGADHMPPQPELPGLLEELRAKLPGVVVRHVGVEAAIDALVARGAPREAHRGELLGNAHHPILSSVWSSRIDLKIENHRVESLLERHAEPLVARLGRAGERHLALLDEAWRLVLLGHPHDDICGCGVDSIHEAGRERLREARTTVECIVADALRELSLGAGLAPRKDVVVLAVHNPHLEAVDEVVECEVHWPRPLSFDELSRLSLVGPDGKPVRVAIELLQTEEEESVMVPRHLDYRTGTLLLARFPAALASTGLAYYELSLGGGPQAASETIDGRGIENNWLKVDARRNGSLAVLDKRTGRVWDELLLFESTPDDGDLYSFSLPPDAAPETTRGQNGARIECWRDDWGSHMLVELEWSPRWVGDAFGGEAPINLEAQITLRDDLDELRVRLVVASAIPDHRLRVLLPCGSGVVETEAGSCFEFVRRPRMVPATAAETAELRKGYPGESEYPTRFCRDLVVAGDAQGSVAVATRGLFEHELVDMGGRDGHQKSFLALTLQRVVGRLSREGGSIRRCGAGPAAQTPLAQEVPLGTELSFSWRPARAGARAHELAPRAFLHAHPPLALQVERGRHERSSARVGPLASAHVACGAPELSLSAIQPRADGAVCLRVWNRSGARVEADLMVEPHLHPEADAAVGGWSSAERVDLMDRVLESLPMSGARTRLSVGPHAIETIILRRKQSWTAASASASSTTP